MSAGQIAAAAAAVVLAFVLVRRRERLAGERKLIGLALVAGLVIYATGLLSALPDPEKLIEDIAEALGKWTYAFVGAMAFLETGAFVGFIAPGEFTVILGGVIAGQGEIAILPLIGIVWACALAGDSASFWIGRRFGRNLMLRHGPKLKITRERFEAVERYFDRHGGKTIIIGRYLGFVRPLAPFIAGTSLPYGRFLPYSVIGTGLWTTTFCVLGYVFWRSFDRVKEVAGQATLAFGFLVAIGIAVWWGYRRLKEPAQRRAAAAWIDRQTRRPLLRPLRPAWRFAGRPFLRVAWPQVKFLFKRFTPGSLGIEFTTAMAVAGTGAYVFVAAAVQYASKDRLAPFDEQAIDIARELRTDTLVDLAKIVTDLGSLPFVAVLVAAGSVALVVRRRPYELFTLLGGFLLVILAVRLAKEGIGRDRPDGGLIAIDTGSYPSGHAAYAATYVVIAVIAARVLRGITRQAALVVVAIAVAAAIGLTRVYLNVHYLSDVLGGWALSLGTFGLLGALALLVAFLRNNQA